MAGHKDEINEGIKQKQENRGGVCGGVCVCKAQALEIVCS